MLTKTRGATLLIAAGFSTVSGYVVVSRYALWIVGDTPHARTALLVAFLLMMAVGTALGGRRIERTSHLAVTAGALALYALGFPLLYSSFTNIYLGLAPPIGDSSLVARNIARFLLSVSIFAVPSILSGIAVATRALFFRWFGVGAAIAALTMPYTLVLKLGLAGTFVLAVIAFFSSQELDAEPQSRELHEWKTRVDPLPWPLLAKIFIVLAAATVLIDLFSARVDLFGSLLGFVLQNTVAVALISVAALALTIAARQGALRSLSLGHAAAFASGFSALGLVTMSPEASLVLLGLAIGMFFAPPSGHWIGYALSLAGLSVLFAPLSVFAWLVPAVFLGAAFPQIRSGAGVGQTSAIIITGAAFAALPGPHLTAPRLGSLLLVFGGLSIYAFADLGHRRAVAVALLCVSSILWSPLLPRWDSHDSGELPQEDALARRRARQLPMLFIADPERVLEMGLETEDGRSVLLESPERYDVVHTDVVRSQEIYILASKQLRRNGALMQSFPLREVSARNLFVVVNTVRSVFDHVSLWTHRDQGFVLASNEPLRLDLESVRRNPSSLEMLGDLVATDADIDRFLDSVANLVGVPRSIVSTDARPALEHVDPTDFLYLQNRAIFERFRSQEPLRFRAEPTRSEEMLAQAAFVRGWNDPRALPRIARAWSEDKSLSGVASQWLFDELGETSVEEVRSQLGAIAALITSGSICEAVTHFVSRVDNVRFSVHATSGESLDGTDPSDAVDGIFHPELGQGWRARALGRTVTLDVRLDAPTPLKSVRVVARAARTRLYGLDMSGVWHPLSSASQDCEGARRFQLADTTLLWKGLRIELLGDTDAAPLTLHEVWAS